MAGPNVRIIVPPELGQDRLQGCTTVHVLIDGLAVSCPSSLAKSLLDAGLAVEDRIVRVFDFESDVYIEADDSWSLGFNGSGVKVAVLDTGVDQTHPELRDSILQSVDFAPGPNIDNNGHGTHVTGIVTANGGRTITGGSRYNLADPNEATGAAPGAYILSARVCRDSCFTSDIEKGIEWAVQQGARVINMSLGGGNFGGHCDGDRLAAKANWAVAQGVVVVAASGNDAAGVSSPACGSKVIAVGAVYQRAIGRQDYSPTCIDETSSPGQTVCFSNTGPALDLAGPGAGILSTYSCNAAGDCSRAWYAWGWGTSQATPHVAAVAALVLGVNGTLTPGEVKNILETTARDLGPLGRDDTYGWGLVDARAAVAKAGGGFKDMAVTEVSPEKTVTYNMVDANPLRVNATVQNLGTLAEVVNVDLLANSTLAANVNVTVDPGASVVVTLEWDTMSVGRGLYVLAVSVEALNGEVEVSNNLLEYGSIQVNFPGDTNGDGVVNVSDLAVVGAAFLSQPGIPSWNSAADLNNDRIVNVQDLAVLGNFFLQGQ